MRYMKSIVIATSAVLLFGCGDEVTISKPTSERFFAENLDRELQRHVGYFSEKDARDMAAFSREMTEFYSKSPSYWDEEKYPKAELLPTTFKYGNGEAITQAYQAAIDHIDIGKKQAQTQYEQELASIQEQVNEAKKKYTDKQAEYKKQAPEIVALMEKKESIKKEWESSKEITTQAANAIAESFGNVLVAHSIPIHKPNPRQFYSISYSEGQCRQQGYVNKRYNTKYVYQHEKDLCITRGLPQLTDEQLAFFKQDENFTQDLEKNTKAQVDVLKIQGELNLRKNPLTGYKQQVSSIDKELKGQYIVFQNKTGESHSSWLSAIDRAEYDYERKQRSLVRYEENKESYLQQLIEEKLRNSKVREQYSSALSQYRDSYLKTFFDNKFEPVSGAEYANISIDIEEDKPWVFVVDVLDKEVTEQYFVHTNKLKKYMEYEKLDGTVDLKSIVKNKVALFDRVRKGDVSGAYQNSARILRDLGEELSEDN